MDELLYEEFLLIQLLLGCSFFGLTTSIWGILKQHANLVRLGLLSMLAASLSGIPMYYQGAEILSLMKQFNYREASIETYKADYYTTLIISLFLGVTSIMSLIMQRALKRIPRLFLYPVLFYALLVVVYLGWRSYFSF